MALIVHDTVIFLPGIWERPAWPNRNEGPRGQHFLDGNSLPSQEQVAFKVKLPAAASWGRMRKMSGFGAVGASVRRRKSIAGIPRR
jgi:hypothetical protein